jgi:hypothetical protein
MTTRVSELPVAASFDGDDQFLVTADGNSRRVSGAVVKGPTFMTPVSTGSGTLFDFNGIAPWANEISIMFNQVSLSGTDNILIQLGTAAAFEATGYLGGGMNSSATAIASSGPVTDGFLVRVAVAARAISGIATIRRYSASSNFWHYSGVLHAGSDAMSYNGGIKETATNLTRLRITRSGGNTFDSGAINVSYR